MAIARPGANRTRLIVRLLPVFLRVQHDTNSRPSLGPRSGRRTGQAPVRRYRRPLQTVPALARGSPLLAFSPHSGPFRGRGGPCFCLPPGLPGRRKTAPGPAGPRRGSRHPLAGRGRRGGTAGLRAPRAGRPAQGSHACAGARQCAALHERGPRPPCVRCARRRCRGRHPGPCRHGYHKGRLRRSCDGHAAPCPAARRADPPGLCPASWPPTMPPGRKAPPDARPRTMQP